MQYAYNCAYKYTYKYTYGNMYAGKYKYMCNANTQGIMHNELYVMCYACCLLHNHALMRYAVCIFHNEISRMHNTLCSVQYITYY